MARLIFGCGYLGVRVAQRWRAAGHDVVVVTRSDQRAEEFRKSHYHTVVADVTRPEALRHLPPADTALFSVGFDRTGGGSILEVYAEGVRNVVAALPSDVGRFIYVSTTGVYGDANGGWIDEDTPTDPQREGGRASLAAEDVLTKSRFASRSVVLRMAGIYGPGRVPFLELLRAGKPIAAAIDGHLNLIHVDDAAAVVFAAAGIPNEELSHERRVYCVSDGNPVKRSEYYGEVARRIGAAEPTFVAPDPNSPRAARAASDRRIRNDRMLADLGVQLLYPDYRAGLAAILG